MEKMISYLCGNVNNLNNDVGVCVKNINTLDKDLKIFGVQLMMLSVLVTVYAHLNNKTLANHKTKILELENKLAEVLDNKGE
jgi:hypothetical protein